MKLYFKTKRDINGNTKKLAIDTDLKIYSLNMGLSDLYDAIIIKSGDRKKIIIELENEGYTRKNFL